jgi:predicted nucleic acid-binding protein
MIFIDTSVFLARHLEQARHHVEALAGWSALGPTKVDGCTNNFVLDELFTPLGRRAGFAFAAERARNL